MRQALTLAILSCLLLCAACVGAKERSSTELAPVLGESALAGQLPGLPEDAWSEAAERSARAIFSYELEATSAYQTNGDFLFPSDLALLPDPGELRYAIFRFGGIDPQAIVTALEVHLLNNAEEAELHFGLADFSSGRWEFITQTASTSPADFELRDSFDPERHVSPGFACYLAVVVTQPDSAVEIDKLVISADGDSVPPLNFLASDALYGDRVQLNWSAVPNADSYQLFYKLASAGEEAWELLKTVPGDKTTVNHEDDFTPPCLYDVLYDYKLRALAGEQFSQFSKVDSGYRRTPAPYFLQATDRMFPDRVELWFPQIFEDNFTIDVFRDGLRIADDVTVDPPDLLEPYMMWADTAAPDVLEHEYFIVVNGSEGSSEPSPQDTGCRGQSSNSRLRVAFEPAQFLASGLIIGPEGSEQIAYAFHNTDDDTVEFMHLDPFVIGLPALEVVQSVSLTSNDISIESLARDGRPYLAYSSDDDNFAAEGLWLAWPTPVLPTEDEDWQTLLLDEGSLRGDRIAMANFAGGIGILYLISPFESSDTILKFCWIPDPDGGPITDVELHPVRTYADLEEHMLAFDMVELQGLPYVLYGLGIQGTSRLYAMRAGHVPPQGDLDWQEHLAVDFLQQYGSAQDIDMVVHDGRLHAAVGVGNGETDTFLVAINGMVDVPSSGNHWGGSIVADTEGITAQGVSLLFSGDVPYIAVNLPIFRYPQLYTSVGPDNGFGFGPQQWIRFELNNNPDLDGIRGRPNLLDYKGLLIMSGDLKDIVADDERELTLFSVHSKDIVN